MTTKQKIILYVALITGVFVMTLVSLIVVFGRPTSVTDVPTEFSSGTALPTDTTDYSAVTQETYRNFVDASAGTTGWEPFQPNGRPIPALAGLTALGVTVPPAFASTFVPDQWGLHSCESDPQKPTFVLRLMFVVDERGEAIPYDQKIAVLSQWESRLLLDVKQVLYPATRYTHSDLLLGTFTDVENEMVPGIRTAPVRDASGTIGSLSYVVVGDVLYIASDTACMTSIAESVVGFD